MDVGGLFVGRRVIDKIIQHKSKGKPFLLKKKIAKISNVLKSTSFFFFGLNALVNGHRRASTALTFVPIRTKPVEQLVVESERKYTNENTTHTQGRTRGSK